MNIEPETEDRVVARAYAIAASELDGIGQRYNDGPEPATESATRERNADGSGLSTNIEEMHKALSDTGATDAIMHPTVAQALGLSPQLLERPFQIQFGKVGAQAWVTRGVHRPGRLIRDIAITPHAASTCIDIAQIVQQGGEVRYSDQVATIEYQGKVLAVAQIDHRGLYYWNIRELLRVPAIQPEGQRSSQAVSQGLFRLQRPYARRGTRVTRGEQEAVMQLHTGSGHMSGTAMADCIRKGLWEGLPEWLTPELVTAVMTNIHCFWCALCKRRQPAVEQGLGVRITTIGHRLSIDYKGPFAIPTIHGHTGYFILADVATTWLMTKLVSSKDTKTVIRVITQARDYLFAHGHVLKEMQADAGKVETGEELAQGLATMGIAIGPAAPEAQAGNPVERAIQMHDKVWLTMQNSQTTIGIEGWGLAVNAATDAINRLGGAGVSATAPEMSRIEAVTGYRPHVSDMAIPYGQRCTSQSTGRRLFDQPRNDAVIFISMLPNRSHASMVIHDPQVQKCSRSRRNLPFVRRHVQPLVLWEAPRRAADFLGPLDIQSDEHGTLTFVNVPSLTPIAGLGDNPLVGEAVVELPTSSAGANIIPRVPLHGETDRAVAPDDAPSMEDRHTMPPAWQEASAELDSSADASGRMQTRQQAAQSRADSEGLAATTSNASRTTVSEAAVPTQASCTPTTMSAEDPVAPDSEYWFSPQQGVESPRASVMAAVRHSIEEVDEESDEPGRWDTEWTTLDETTCKTAQAEGHDITSAMRAARQQAEYNMVWGDRPEAEVCTARRMHVQRTDLNPTLNMVFDPARPELGVVWKPPLREDFQKHRDSGALIEVPAEHLASGEPSQREYIRWMFDFKVKRNKNGDIIRYKVRFNLRGDDELRAGKFPDRTELYAPNVKAYNLRHFIANAAFHGHELSLMDVTQAFGHTPWNRPTPLYVKVPKYVICGDYEQQRDQARATGVYFDEMMHFQLGAVMHGLADAAHAWNEVINAVLVDHAGMTRSKGERCLYTWFGDNRESAYLIALTTDDSLEATARTEAAQQKRQEVREALQTVAPITIDTQPKKAVGLILCYNPDLSIGIVATVQTEEPIELVFGQGEEARARIPETWIPMRTDWDGQQNDHGAPFEIEAYRQATGFGAWITRARLDVTGAFARLASRTSKCTDHDWQDVRNFTAYLHTTKDLQLVYHRKRQRSETANVTGAADASFRTYSDGKSHLAGGTKAASGMRGPSGMIDLFSTKDSGYIADTVPEVELKALAKQTKLTIYHAGISAEMGNEYEQPPIIEEDNDTVENASRDTSGKDRAFKNRINTLDSIRSACTEELVQIQHVDSAQQTVDSHTKLLGPMDHWRNIGATMGESPQLAEYRKRVFDRYAKKRPPNHEVKVVREAESTWGEGQRPWESEELRAEDIIYQREEREDQDITLSLYAADAEEMEAHDQRLEAARTNMAVNALPQGLTVSRWIREQSCTDDRSRGGVPESRAARVRAAIARGAKEPPPEESDSELTRREKNRTAAEELMQEMAQPAECSPQRRRREEVPLSPLMSSHATFGERGSTKKNRQQKRRRDAGSA